MGCDIHCYREKLVNDQWVTADNWVKEDEDDYVWIDVPYEQRYQDRNYQLFGTLVKYVRSSNELSFDERGIPSDVSPEVEAVVKRWDCDGHSHSYLYLHELKELYTKSKQVFIPIESYIDQDALAALQNLIETKSSDWSPVWKCLEYERVKKWTKIEMDVPLHLYIGQALDEIIGLFDDVDAEDHRIVFFFDN